MGKTTRTIKQVHGKAQQEADAVLFLHQQTRISPSIKKVRLIKHDMTEFDTSGSENQMQQLLTITTKCVQYKLYTACTDIKRLTNTLGFNYYRVDA